MKRIFILFLLVLAFSVTSSLMADTCTDDSDCEYLEDFCHDSFCFNGMCGTVELSRCVCRSSCPDDGDVCTTNECVHHFCQYNPIEDCCHDGSDCVEAKCKVTLPMDWSNQDPVYGRSMYLPECQGNHCAFEDFYVSCEKGCSTQFPGLCKDFDGTASCYAASDCENRCTYEDGTYYLWTQYDCILGKCVYTEKNDCPAGMACGGGYCHM